MYKNVFVRLILAYFFNNTKRFAGIARRVYRYIYSIGGSLYIKAGHDLN